MSRSLFIVTIVIAATSAAQAGGKALYLPPSSVEIIEDGNGHVTVSGYVFNGNPDDTVVIIDGVLGYHVLTLEVDGYFSGTLDVPPDTSGGITLQAEDTLQNRSNTVNGTIY